MAKTSFSNVPRKFGAGEFHGPITMVGNGRVTLEVRPELDFARIAGIAKPTRVTRGAYTGFSLPLYAADQELFMAICIPDRWSGDADIELHIYCYLDEANTGKAFRLVAAYNYITVGVDAVPDGLTDVPVQTDTDGAAQYQSFEVIFIIPYTGMAAEDQLAIRLRRVAVEEADEIGGKVVITHWGMIFTRDKMGAQA